VGPRNPTENNNKFILTFIDDHTKFFIAIPIPNQEANTIAKNFTTEIICKFGMPQTVLTDQGTNFESAIFRETCKLLKIKKNHGTSFHPQTNGSLERTHQSIGLHSKIRKRWNYIHRCASGGGHHLDRASRRK
jgi:transposase InsO family protein